jgi:hypothetical protein
MRVQKMILLWTYRKRVLVGEGFEPSPVVNPSPVLKDEGV